jgi:gliding motility-associated-like protein
LWSSGFPNNSCDTVYEVLLLVLPIIDASIISDSVFCEEDPTINLQAMNSGGVWSGTGITDVNLGTFNPSVATVGNHLITYEIPNSCGDSGTINILVNETPNITKLTKDDSCLLSNGYIDLSIIGGTLPYSYYWNNGGTTEDLPDLNSGTYIIIVTDNEGCIKSDTIIIEDNLLLCGGSLWLPNIFSPNNDLLNDILYVRGAETAQTFEFIIYNRWGQKVYYSTDPAAGWDGTFDGKILNDAVFAYLVTATFLDGTDAVLSGTITLVK